MSTKAGVEDRKRKKKRLLREQVYSGIKNAIISGEFEPGKRLIEERLAEDMKTSRTPVREAIQKLEKEGLIQRLPRGGFAVKGVSEEEVEDVFGLREVLEGYAGFLAAARIGDEEMKELERSSSWRTPASKTWMSRSSSARRRIPRQALPGREEQQAIRAFERPARLHVQVQGDPPAVRQKGNVRRPGSQGHARIDKDEERQAGREAREKAYDEGQEHHQEKDKAGPGAKDIGSPVRTADAVSSRGDTARKGSSKPKEVTVNNIVEKWVEEQAKLTKPDKSIGSRVRKRR